MIAEIYNSSKTCVMKAIIKTTAVLLFGILAFISCKSKEENSEENLQQTTAIEKDADSISGEVEASNTNSPAKSDNNASQSYPATAGSKTNKKGEKMSAPDGTNKENHDGDMYTKNDTTRMPSGTTIK